MIRKNNGSGHIGMSPPPAKIPLPRRYGEKEEQPWKPSRALAAITKGATGSYDFSSRVGIYTGAQPGDAGDLMVFEPRTGQVYGYGQKDRRGKKTEISHAVWDGERFVPCDKLGRVK